MSTADLNFLNLNTLFVLLSQIVFEAIRGSSIRSDIAIDDVILEGGPCPGKQTETSYKKTCKKGFQICHNFLLT